MQRYEREKNQGGRIPAWRSSAWRSSEGRLREAAPVSRREGRDHLTGYEPPAAEKTAGSPREAGRLASSYGDVAVGVSRKKELTLVISKRRNRQGPAAGRDEKVLKGDSVRRVNLARRDFRVNSHDPQKSALAYRESHKRPPQFLLERFKELMSSRQQDTLEELVPFLTRKDEQEELRQLQSRAEDLQAKESGAGSLALRHIEIRKQELRQRLTEKQSQERRLRLLLQKAQEESRRRAGEAETVHSLPPYIGPAGEEPPPEDGEPRDGKSEDGKPKGMPEDDGRADGEDDDLAEKLAAQLLVAALKGRKKKDEKSAESTDKKSVEKSGPRTEPNIK